MLRSFWTSRCTRQSAGLLEHTSQVVLAIPYVVTVVALVVHNVRVENARMARRNQACVRRKQSIPDEVACRLSKPKVMFSCKLTKILGSVARNTRVALPFLIDRGRALPPSPPRPPAGLGRLRTH